MKKLLLFAVSFVALFGFLKSNTTLAAANGNSIEYETHKLVKNDMNITADTSSADVLSEVVRQYKYSYPDYAGSVTAYTREQYDKHLKTGSEDHIDMAFVQKADLLRLIKNRAEVSKVTSTAFPYSSIGVITTFFSLPNGVMVVNSPSLISTSTKPSGKSDTDATLPSDTGTGFVINVNKIATAAHCFYDHSLGYVDGASIVFSNNANIGGGQLTSMNVPSDFKTNSGSQMDFGTAIAKLNIASPTSFVINSDNNSTYTAKSISFPADPIADGYTMYQSSGSVEPASFENHYSSIDFYESTSVRSHHGMSGGPLLDSSNHVIGINAYEWHHDDGDDDDSNNDPAEEFRWGFRRITPEVYAFLKE